METFTRDGLTFDVTDSGETSCSGTGAPVVLLHGFPQDRTAWDGVSARLQAEGLRTLAPDQRGYSPRATPPGRTAYGLDALTDDIVALIDAAGAERAHVVGHDWGGAVAWNLGRRHADRLASLTVLSTPHPGAMAWAFTHGDQWRKSLYMLFFQLPWLPERQVQQRLIRLYRSGGMSLEQAQRYADRFPTPESLTGPLGWYRSMPASRAMTRAMKRRGASPSPTQAGRPRGITVPTTYVWGRDDFALGRAAAEKTADFVAGDYRFVELDAGHWLPEVDTEDVADAILDRIRSVA